MYFNTFTWVEEWKSIIFLGTHLSIEFAYFKHLCYVGSDESWLYMKHVYITCSESTLSHLMIVSGPQPAAGLIALKTTGINKTDNDDNCTDIIRV